MEAKVYIPSFVAVNYNSLPPSNFERLAAVLCSLKDEIAALTHLCRPVRSTFAVRETASLGQQMLNAPVGINGLRG